MRKPIIAGNWKMNNSISETIEFINDIKSKKINENVESVIIAPFTNLYVMNEGLKDTELKLGAQNMYFENNGAFTGEISAKMLKDIGVDYVIIGHSERRGLFNETDDMLNKKVKSALKNGLNPILCCGETFGEREDNRHKKKVEKQIRAGLVDLNNEEISKIVIAYEPIWAIGTGLTASSEDAEDMCKFIRELIEEMYNKDVSEKIRIQYGGSVKPSNISEIMEKENIDGALVGGASLDVESFIQLINFNQE